MALTQITTDGIKDGTITGTDLTTNIDLVDNQKLRFGTGNDLEIYHNATNSVIADVGNGNLSLQTNGTEINFWNPTDNEYLARFSNGAYVKLYYDGSKKFETTSTGATVTGNITATGTFSSGSGSDQLNITHSGGGASHVAATGDLVLKGTDNVYIGGVNNETHIKCTENGRVELYYDNAIRLITSSTGIQPYGDVRHTDNIKATFGTSQDLQIYHDGTNSFITNATNALSIANETSDAILYIKSDSIFFRNAANNEEYIKCNKNSSVDLYFDNSKKFETVTGGATITGVCTATSFAGDGSNLTGISSVGGSTGVSFNDNVAITLGTGNDTFIRHIAGSHTEIDHVGSGDLVLETVNGGDDILLDSNDDIFLNHAGESMIVCRSDAQVELYYNNTKTLETILNGIKIHGGAGEPNLLGTLTIVGGTTSDDHQGIAIMPGDSNSQAHVRFGYGSTLKWQWRVPFHSGGAESKMQLYNWTTGDDVLKIAPNGDQDVRGTIFPRANNTYDLGTSGNRWRNIYTNDLNLSNEGGANDVDGTWGSYTIQEGAEDLFLVNKRSGKKYKFNLTEVS